MVEESRLIGIRQLDAMEALRQMLHERAERGRDRAHESIERARDRVHERAAADAAHEQQLEQGAAGVEGQLAVQAAAPQSEADA
jgi:uncharacterized protein YgbK (DUF1537 family)